MPQKILMQNSTHKAVKNLGNIDIYLKGFQFQELICDQQFLFSIEGTKDYKLPDIFKQFNEENITLLAEAGAEYSNFFSI